MGTDVPFVQCLFLLGLCERPCFESIRNFVFLDQKRVTRGVICMEHELSWAGT